MPRYYFHMTLNGEHRPDMDGADLPDRRVARQEATRMIGQMVKDSATRCLVDQMVMTVRDDAHDLVGQFAFSFAERVTW